MRRVLATPGAVLGESKLFFHRLFVLASMVTDAVACAALKLDEVFGKF
jgi:hypothetical protein